MFLKTTADGQGATGPQSGGGAIVDADEASSWNDLSLRYEMLRINHQEAYSADGPCATLKVFENHRPVLAALQSAGRGRILVIDAGGSLRIGVLGDRLASIGMNNEWLGAVIFGAVRDTVGIDKLAFGVKALGATARRGERETAGFADVPVTFGNCTFEPGDWVYADVDAVTVSKSKLALDGG